MSQSEPPWVGRYVGIPFLDRGSSIHGCYCWGLVRLVFKEQLAIELPSYGAISASEIAASARLIEANATLPPWTIAEAPYRCFDVATFYQRPDPSKPRIERHIGVMINATTVLHVECGCDTVKESLAGRLRFTLARVRRHEALV